MVGAPDIDHVRETAIELVPVIGDVRGKISVGAIGLQKRSIDVVAIGGRTKQRLLPVFLILDRPPLWRRPAALINVALGAKKVGRFCPTTFSPPHNLPL